MLQPTSMKFMFRDGRTLEIDEYGFMLLENDKIILDVNVSEYTDVPTTIQISDLTQFKIFKDKKKEFVTYKFED